MFYNHVLISKKEFINIVLNTPTNELSEMAISFIYNLEIKRLGGTLEHLHPQLIGAYYAEFPDLTEVCCDLQMEICDFENNGGNFWYLPDNTILIRKP